MAEEIEDAVDAQVEAVDDLPIVKDYQQKFLDPDLLDDEIDFGDEPGQAPRNQGADMLEEALDSIVANDFSDQSPSADNSNGRAPVPGAATNETARSTPIGAGDIPGDALSEDEELWAILNSEENFVDSSLDNADLDRAGPALNRLVNDAVAEPAQADEGLRLAPDELPEFERIVQPGAGERLDSRPVSASGSNDSDSERPPEEASIAASEQTAPGIPTISPQAARQELSNIDKIAVVEKFLSGQGVSPDDITQLAPAAKLELFDQIAAAEAGLGSGAPADAAPDIYMAARRAELGGPNEAPIEMNDPKEGMNEINLPLTAFNQLEYGQTGFITFSVRPWPGFRERANAWLKARKAGTDLDYAAKRPVHMKAWDAAKYGYQYLVVALQDPRRGRAEKPTAPWRRMKELTPLPQSQVDPDEKQAWKDAADKASDTAHFEVTMRAGVFGVPENEEAGAQMEMIIDDVTQGMAAFDTVHQAFAWEPGHAQDALLCNMGPDVPKEARLILASRELAMLAHPSDDSVRPNGIKVSRSSFKQLPMQNPVYIEDPYNPVNGAIPIGVMNAHSEDEAVIGMRNAELDKHMIIVGKTGSGKSEWLKWLVHGIIRDDYPLVLIDPHGQLAAEVLNSLVINAEDRWDDIAYIDIADEHHPVAMNPLDIKSYGEVDGTVDSVMQMLSSPKINLGASGAPRAVVYAKEAILALCHANISLEDPLTKCTLLDVLNFFQDPDFRRLVIECCKNPSVRQKYDPDIGLFEQMSEKMQIEHTQALTRAFSELANSSAFQAVFSSPENKLDFAKMIGANKIVIVKLARFGGGSSASLGAFVGSLVLPWLLSSMTHWGRKKDEITGEISGRGCRVLVDEAPTLMGPSSSVPETLAEARKWDLGLIMAAQFLDQFDASIIDAALVNTNSKISMVQDPNKAGPITKAIAGSSSRISAEDLASLPNYHFYGNVLIPTEIGASASGPFSAACLPMINHKLEERHLAAREKIIEKSRASVCNDAQMIADLSMRRKENIMDGLKNFLREENAGKIEEVGAPRFNNEIDDGDDLWN